MGLKRARTTTWPVYRQTHKYTHTHTAARPNHDHVCTCIYTTSFLHTYPRARWPPTRGRCRGREGGSPGAAPRPCSSPPPVCFVSCCSFGGVLMGMETSTHRPPRAYTYMHAKPTNKRNARFARSPRPGARPAPRWAGGAPPLAGMPRCVVDGCVCVCVRTLWFREGGGR